MRSDGPFDRVSLGHDDRFQRQLVLRFVGDDQQRILSRDD